MRSHSSSSISASGVGLFSTPALLKAMSSRPNVSTSARDRRLHLLRDRDVAADDQHLATRILDRIGGLPQRILRPVEDGDASAFGGERDGGGAADATGGSGNEGDLAGKTIGAGHALPRLGVDGSCLSRSRIMTFRGVRARLGAVRHSQSRTGAGE